MAVMDTFGTFLETREALRHGASRSRVREPAMGPLELLQWGKFPASPRSLQEQTPLSFEDLADALRRLTEAGLVTLEQGDTEAVVTLTPKGEALRAR